jgi:hypothetical protein
MARRRTTRTLASRIELDYYRRPHWMRAWRARVSATAFALPLLFFGGLVSTGDERALSPGTLSAFHEAFAERCEACHTPWAGVEDASCATCHRGEQHHESQEFRPSCASCHREHGAELSIASPHDAHCTQCHADLTVAGRRQSLRFARHVESFALHPEFAFLRERIADPGAVKLNHQKHLALEMPGLSRKMLCSDCHRPDATGRLMQPIAYARDCAACHELSLPGRLSGLRLTHGQPFAEMREELHQLASRRALDPLAPREGVDPPPRIGSGSRETALADESVQEWIGRAVDEGLEFAVRTRCAECHEVEHDADGAPVRSAPPAIPSRWMPYSEFSHASHRAVECDDCHTSIAASARSADVNLPSIALCRGCHGEDGGARTDCVLCHDYHPHHVDMSLTEARELRELLREAGARPRAQR